MRRRTFSGSASYASYGPAPGWFVCDRHGTRVPRAQMLTEWTGLKVCGECIDPRPPQMQPPNVYPEGMPFFDARPPQDKPDRLQDDTSLQSITGGINVSPPGEYYAGGQNQQPGALSPLQLEDSPVQYGADVLADDVTFITGPVAAPSQGTD